MKKLNSDPNYYNEIASSYNELHGEEQLKKAKIILNEVLKHKTEGILLDVGGGTGISTELFTDNFECILIDPSESLIEQGPANIEKILGEAEELPFSDEKFDVIISITSLHHTDLKQAIEEIARVTKQDSTIAISFLKKSCKLEEFRKLFKENFINTIEIEEEKDIIFLNKKL
ncbi:class I SAM-dependent methyltransferase [Candidatus Woesearchaeota archaeon]|nr:class I SAM-dependent methyltransferase [Candidatus Woesearchaeota archaeon]